jgi:hypothetical protein
MTHRYKTAPQDKQAPQTGKVENDRNKLGHEQPTQKNEARRTPESRHDRDDHIGGHSNQNQRATGSSRSLNWKQQHPRPSWQPCGRQRPSASFTKNWWPASRRRSTGSNWSTAWGTSDASTTLPVTYLSVAWVIAWSSTQSQRCGTV